MNRNVNVDANVNVNVNSNAGLSLNGVVGSSIRCNTYKILRQSFDANEAISEKSTGYEPYGSWDAEHKAWVYLAEFVKDYPDWFTTLKPKSDAVQTAADFGTAAKFDAALKQLIDASGEREDRFAEIVDQHDGDGAINYWLGMLMIRPARQPNTYLLIRAARKLGEMIVMCLKAEYNAARPSQLSPAIVPMLDPPGTASFPSGHSLQAYLISCLLRKAMPKLPQSKRPDHWLQDGSGNLVRHGGLFALARRIADNRLIAGLHFDADNEAGFVLAKAIDDMISTAGKCAELQSLIAAAKLEFPQYQ